MEGKSHEQDDVVTRSVNFEASVDGLAEYVAAVVSGEVAAEFELVEQEIRRHVAAIECAATARALETYEPTAEVIEVDGRTYKRLGEGSEVVYFGMTGGLRVGRHLYREVGVRNGPTIVPLELNAGIVEGRLTPMAAQAAAFLMQALPSREAKETARRLGVLPFSRSTMVRTGEAMGQKWEGNRVEAEDYLSAEQDIPDEAVAASVSVDRVAVPMEELRKRGPGRPRKGAGKRPVEVVYRMAYCGVLTLYDEDGEPLRSIRYGRMPAAGARTEMESSLAGDVHSILAQRPELRVVTLADGAPEMQNMLGRIVLGVPVQARLVDFWHVIEKLAAAIKATGRTVKPKLAKWRRRLKQRDNAIEHIEIELRSWALEYAEESVPEALHEALTYIENNREGMRYASARTANLPIGSGQVEATCKTIVTTRMKRCGARWKMVGGQAIMSLRSLATSTRWDPAMAFLLSTYRKPIRASQDAA